MPGVNNGRDYIFENNQSKKSDVDTLCSGFVQPIEEVILPKHDSWTSVLTGEQILINQNCLVDCEGGQFKCPCPCPCPYGSFDKPQMVAKTAVSAIIGYFETSARVARLFNWQRPKLVRMESALLAASPNENK